MPEINYKEIDSHLKNAKHSTGDAGAVPPVYLIYGEELLCKSAFERILNCLLPSSERELNFEPLGGEIDAVPEAIQRMNTYSLLPGTKVIALNDSRIFYSKQDEDAILEKVREAASGNQVKKAGRCFMDLLEILGLVLDDIDPDQPERALNLKPETVGDGQWLKSTVAYCRAHGVKPSTGGNYDDMLQRAVEAGFPKNNHLVITTDLVDKRRRLYKAIKEHGIVVDCSVPRGDRKADRAVQDQVLREAMKNQLAASKKTLNQDAYQALIELTGFDLRTFTGNIEKLISYTGDRTTICRQDVEGVLKRTRKDPLYELTNAVSDRDVERSLFYLGSLFADEFHPLQLLAAIGNQIRRLLLVKDFVESKRGRSWYSGCPYNQFQQTVLAEIKAHDQELVETMERWSQELSQEENRNPESATPKGKKKRQAPKTDLLLARQSGSPYPIYLTFKKCERFSRSHLVDCLDYLSDADIQLKTGSQNGKIILERLIFSICGL